MAFSSDVVDGSQTYFDKTSGKVVQLNVDVFATLDSALSPWLDKACFPEGVQDLLLYSSDYSIGNYGEWKERKKNGAVVCMQSLYIYEHSTSAISTAKQCGWDSALEGVIGVQADTEEQAERYLNQIVKVWDNFLKYGGVLALMYDSLKAFTEDKDTPDAMSVDASKTSLEQAKEAADYLLTAKEADAAVWVPLREARREILKTARALGDGKSVDEMTDSEVRAALEELKRATSFIEELRWS